MGTGRYLDAKSGTLVAIAAIVAMLSMSAVAFAPHLYSSDTQFQTTNDTDQANETGETNETQEEIDGEETDNVSENATEGEMTNETNVTAIPISTNETTGNETNETTSPQRMDTFSAQFSVASLVFPQNEDRFAEAESPNTTATNETNETTENETVESNESVVNETEETTETNETLNSTTAYQTAGEENELPYILSGEGEISVVDGNVEVFDMVFDMVHVDGTERHMHEVMDFQQRSGATMDENGDAIIHGVSNISTDGNTAWDSVDTTIMVREKNAVSVYFSPVATNDHFESQAVLGIVDSVEDGANETAGNETGVDNETGGFGNDTGGTGIGEENMTGGVVAENETTGGIGSPELNESGNETGEVNIFQSIWIAITNFFSGNASDNEANTQVNVDTGANVNSVPQ